MNEQNKDTQLNSSVADSGAYSIIKQRLENQTDSLKSKAQKLNAARINEFGATDFSIKGRTRVRTENACIPRDMVQINDQLLFGYNVKIGMKSNIEVKDVLGLYGRQQQPDGTTELVQLPYEGTFLDNVNFKKQFADLYRFYKNSQLIQLKIANGFVLASFQTGTKATDVKVFRWSIHPVTNQIDYVDDRGEEFIKPPAAHDFLWVDTSRADHVSGEHPHVSILDKVFVECIDGDLTIKVENNTSVGKGIYSEPVDEKNQSLSDAKISYADLGNLIILKITPYKESKTRYIVFNNITKSAKRIDAIEHSCIQLPEGHGIIFPGGYYLTNGETKTVDGDNTGMSFKRSIKSPNGEDVLFVFYRETDGMYSILSYNIIEKQIITPILAHGYSLFPDGDLLLFRAEEGEEPTRMHMASIWSTAFVSEEFSNQVDKSEGEPSFFRKLGNAEIVRAISDIYSLTNDIRKLVPSVDVYEHLIAEVTNVQDAYYWLANDQAYGISQDLQTIKETSELVLDEFEKVVAIKAKSEEALQSAVAETKKTLSKVKINQRKVADDYVQDLHVLRRSRGHLVTVREMRYMDLPAIDALVASIDEVEKELNGKLSKFLQDEKAFRPYSEQLEQILLKLSETKKVVDVEPLVQKTSDVALALDLINQVISNLEVEDSTIVTNILENVSTLYSKLNQVRAKVNNQRKDFLRQEKSGQFASQIKLFSQNISNSLSVSLTPEKTDEEATKIFNQLETLESEYADFEDYLSVISEKREEVQDTFESHKQKLLAEIKKRSDNIYKTASRTLESVTKRIESFDTVEELNTYLTSDSLVIKAQKLIEDLRQQNDTMRADDLLAKLKSIKDQSIRVLRDKSEIYEDSGRIMKMGKHKFSVHKGTPELSIVQQEKNMSLHITGTEFFENVSHEELYSLSQYWDSHLVSESQFISRAEYLAGKFIEELSSGKLSISLDQAISMNQEDLLAEVSRYATPRYQEAYDKGVHDHDATLILGKALGIYKNLGFLRYDSETRAKAMLTALELKNSALKHDIKVAIGIYDTTGNNTVLKAMFEKARGTLNRNICDLELEVSFRLSVSNKWIVTKEASELNSKLEKYLLDNNYSDILNSLTIASLLDYQHLVLSSLCMTLDSHVTKAIAEEAASILAVGYLDKDVILHSSDVSMSFEVVGLLSSHSNIESGKLSLYVDDWMSRVSKQFTVVAPAINRISKIKSEITINAKDKLNVNDFKANPLTSFVRNRLIMESYFPIIGDNLAKQMGAVGNNKRSDLMGMLLLISPPGYGKTTLIEYVANKLGLVFMKINCPSLGHQVTSLDPEQAPHTTARKELEKLNLALEMGNNVMLYLDDIQHTDPEFLQKFISLCDGTRKIEGVWNGKTKTYDMRGKRFAVVMAGNPYTESGDTFKIPDMLANRADIYNLGDMLSGSEEVFASSYIENALTSNPVLAPLATRSLQDVYRFIKKAQGEEISSNEFDYDYSAAESDEIISILKKMFIVRDTVMKANAAYVESAATANEFRIKPAFKLQGSYRNMAKMSEKIMSVMTDAEIQQLILDHYQGESQTLTTGAEENILHLKELMGVLTESEKDRWELILETFRKSQSMGGKNADALTKVAHTLSDLKANVEKIALAISEKDSKEHFEVLHQLVDELKGLKTEISHDINIDIANSDEHVAKVISDIMKNISNFKTEESKLVDSGSEQSESSLLMVKNFNRVVTRLEQAILPMVEASGKNSVVMFNVWERLEKVIALLSQISKNQV